MWKIYFFRFVRFFEKTQTMVFAERVLLTRQSRKAASKWAVGVTVGDWVGTAGVLFGRGGGWGWGRKRNVVWEKVLTEAFGNKTCFFLAKSLARGASFPKCELAACWRFFYLTSIGDAKKRGGFRYPKNRYFWIFLPLNQFLKTPYVREIICIFLRLIFSLGVGDLS